jgi:hypothetical protein
MKLYVFNIHIFVVRLIIELKQPTYVCSMCYIGIFCLSQRPSFNHPKNTDMSAESRDSRTKRDDRC